MRKAGRLRRWAVPLALSICGSSAMNSVEAAASGRMLRVEVVPAKSGSQLVRVSLPFSKGLVREGETLLASDGSHQVAAALRPLTWYPAARKEPCSIRRGLVTFPYHFTGTAPVTLMLRAGRDHAPPPRLPVQVRVEGEVVHIAYPHGPILTASLIAPGRYASTPARTEVVESNQYYLWQRVHLDSPQYPRILEVRADALGQVVVVAHLERKLAGNGTVPDFGWHVSIDARDGVLESGSARQEVGAQPLAHTLEQEAGSRLFFAKGTYALYHPVAPLTRRGRVVMTGGEDGLGYRYLRAMAAEQVPIQEAAWVRAEFVVGPAAAAPLRVTLESPHTTRVAWEQWDALYDTGAPPELSSQPELAHLLQYHHDAIVRSMCHGDDLGNVSSFSDNQDTGRPHGMDRLNHCAAIFEEGWRSGDRRLTETALLWCDNAHDRSVWWGEKGHGGTRYPARAGVNDPAGDWRSNSSVDFCTKGFAAFFLAYEQTGDPRMREAAEAQYAYAAGAVHANAGEPRNIGVVHDVIRLYRYTGEQRYLDTSLRLFRELREKLSPGDLFSESGEPIEPDPPFINHDAFGTLHPFAKPYIIGYALAGLPELAADAPQEPKLRDVVQAVADFMARSEDPLGGWRYPHPNSSTLFAGQAIEHAWQLVQADTLLGPQPAHLDAIERVLRQRVLVWRKSGRILESLDGWEFASGKAKQTADLQSLYRKPGDRDASRDYTEGELSLGGSAPEGLVYFPQVLTYDLRHRPAERLLASPAPEEPLGKVLARVSERANE